MDEQIETNETISAEEFENFIDEMARIGRIAEHHNRLNAQIAELKRAEHPTRHFATSHQAEATFDSIEAYGDINLLYQDRYEEHNERITISREDLTDPDFEAKAQARIAELTAARAAEAAIRDQAAKELAAARTIEQEAAERELFVRLRDKYEGVELDREVTR